MPRRGQRAGLRFAVTYNAGNHQVGVVEGRTKRMRERISQLTAFIDRAGDIRRAVAGNAAGKRELLEQALHPVDILANVRIHFAVAAFQVGVSHQRGSAVSGTDDCEYIPVTSDNDSIQMRVDEIDAGSGSPVTQQSGLDVRERQRLPPPG